MNQKKPQGFHLLELLLSISILGLSLCIVIYYGIKPAATSAKHIAYELSSLIHAAKMFSLELGAPVYLKTHTGSNNIELFTDENNNKNILRSYSCLKCSIIFQGFKQEPKADLSFIPLGSYSNNGRFSISARGETCELIINDAGRTRIECGTNRCHPEAKHRKSEGSTPIAGDPSPWPSSGSG
jgi:hypothetical protein